MTCFRTPARSTLPSSLSPPTPHALPNLLPSLPPPPRPQKWDDSRIRQVSILVQDAALPLDEKQLGLLQMILAPHPLKDPFQQGQAAASSTAPGAAVASAHVGVPDPAAQLAALGRAAVVRQLSGVVNTASNPAGPGSAGCQSAHGKGAFFRVYVFFHIFTK